MEMEEDVPEELAEEEVHAMERAAMAKKQVRWAEEEDDVGETGETDRYMGMVAQWNKGANDREKSQEERNTQNRQSWRRKNRVMETKRCRAERTGTDGEGEQAVRDDSECHVCGP